MQDKTLDYLMSGAPKPAPSAEPQMPEENCCEHGDHPAPAGKRFCSRECAECEHTEHDASVSECACKCLDVVRRWQDMRYERDEARKTARELAPDVVTKEERAVLETMSKLSDEWLRSDWCIWRKPADAELARRAAKEKP